MYDIIIKNGTIIDGTGGPRFLGDIAIQDDKIVAVGNLATTDAGLKIDARGKVVAPGCIDVNSHTDVFWQLFQNPTQESMVAQGVTTVIGGNAGSSLAPLVRKQDIRSIQKWTDVDHINFNWLTTKEFLDEVERKKIGVNFATLAGHGTMRRAVMRDQSRSITPEEVNMLNQLLDNALHEGALGMSTGLKYTHALTAAPRELSFLAKTVKKEDGIYATYIRNESDALIPAVEEAVLIGLEAKARVHISHLKAVYEENWGKMDEVLERISTSALQGIEISFDVYPYTSTSSVLYTLLPEWVTRKGRVMMLAQLRDPSVRAAVIQDMQKEPHNYTELQVAISKVNSVAAHKKMSEIAELQGVTPEEAVLDILLASEGRAIVNHEVLSPLNIEKCLASPHSIVSSNGAGYALDHGKTGDVVHPRNFGTFPRVLGEYVRKKKILSLEEAIHKMSGKPAEVFRLEKRGIIKPGNFADIFIFDPETIIDTATADEPYQLPHGIGYVLVNGVPAYVQGKVQGALAGRVLRKSQKKWYRW